LFNNRPIRNLNTAIKIEMINSIINKLSKDKDFTSKYNTGLLKKIISFSLYTENNWKGRTTKYSNAVLTKEDLFLFINNRLPNDSTQDSKKLSEIEKHLNLLSTKYDSIYGKDLCIFEKINNTYQYKGKHNTAWNKLGFFFPNLGIVNFPMKKLKEYNHDMPFKLLLSYIATATENKIDCEHNLIFSYEQIQNAFGLTRGRFNSLCKKFDFDYNMKQTSISKSETRNYEVSDKHSSITRGIYFTHKTVERAKKYLNDNCVTINYFTMYCFRMALYKNNRQIDQFTFKSLPTIGYDRFDSQKMSEYVKNQTNWNESLWNIILDKHSVKNQTKVWYTEDHISKNIDKNSKFSTLYNVSGVYNGKEIESMKNEISTKRELEESAMNSIKMLESITDSFNNESTSSDKSLIKETDESEDFISTKVKEVISINNFSKFYAKTREIYSECKRHYKTINVFYALKKELIKQLENSDSMIKDYMIGDIEKINSPKEALKSAIFEKNYHKYFTSSEDSLKFKMAEEIHILKRNDKVDHISDMDFCMKFNSISDNCEEMTVEELTGLFNDNFKDNIISEEMKERIESRIVLHKNSLIIKEMKETTKQEKDSISIHDIFEYVLNNVKYDSIKDYNNCLDRYCSMNDIVKRFSNKLKSVDKEFVVNHINSSCDIKVDLLKKYFNFELNEENKIHNINLLSVVKEEKVEKNEIREIIIERIEGLGLRLGREISYERLHGFELQVKLGMKTIESIIEDLLI